MSSYLVSVLSSSLDVLTCLLVVVFLSRRYLPSFVLRRPAFVLLVCLRFLLCWQPELLCRQLIPLLHRSCPHLQGGRVTLLQERVGRARTLSVATATGQVTQSQIVTRSEET